ncbi:MAG: hypothetical protein LBH98_06880 [Chitinispirillales bacterium]|jgi:hypothetical protein|nr:hypothetical protein [Chitinispirillales bacterium]
MQNKNRFLEMTATVVIVAQMVSAATDITAKFTDPNFRTEVYKAIGKTPGVPILDSYVSDIKYLDVSNKNITSIAGIECFTELLSFDCSWNQLTKVDISNNTSLTHLGFGHNQLASLDVSKNTALIDLWCYSNELTALDVSENLKIQQLLCNNNNLTELNVSNNIRPLAKSIFF